jgi:uncharacterized protein GlcG (DUF336 family)
MTNVIQKTSMSAELAQKMVDAALAKANVMGVAVSVAILEERRQSEGFSRMDGAPILSKEIAPSKVYTALFPARNELAKRLFGRRDFTGR